MSVHSKPKFVLGLTYGHGDSSAAILKNNRLVAAVEEERISRIKHCASFPERAIEFCLKEAGAKPEDVQTIAIARRPNNAAHQKALALMRNPQLIESYFHISKRRQETPLEQRLEEVGLGGATIERIEHHHAHMYSSRYMSQHPKVALMSLDGLGDFVSTAAGIAHENEIEVLDRIYFPHSLGNFYTALTLYLGFPHYGDEFKMMGLSSYGRPRYLSALRELIQTKSGFRFELDRKAFPVSARSKAFSIKGGRPTVMPFYDESVLRDLLGFPARKTGTPIESHHEDLARSAQVCFEEIANHLLDALYDLTKVPNLALSGGCAHNSVWVGKVPASTRFKNVAVAPAAHDAGLAIGAAIGANQGAVLCNHPHPALIGPTPYTTSKELGPMEGYEHRCFPSQEGLADWMAQELAQGKIFGFVSGRLEFGPRALGARSILADPRTAEMRDRLNHRVKHREGFRPFAASVLREHQQDWFLNVFDCPQMEAVFEVKAQVHDRIKAVVHVDGTCRIQSVSRETQPFFWELIEAFRKVTGVPMLINTSFNDSEPIVCSAQDAIKCFRTSDIDHLVIEDTVYTKVEEFALAS